MQELPLLLPNSVNIVTFFFRVRSHVLLVSLLNRQSSDQTPPDNLASRSELRLVPAVIAQIPFIESAQARVTADMESMVLTGLTTLVCSLVPLLLLILTSSSVMQNQTLLASSLQTAFNLGVLPSLVQNLVTNICRETEEQIRGAFDLMRISKSNSEVKLFFIHRYSDRYISFPQSWALRSG